MSQRDRLIELHRWSENMATIVWEFMPVYSKHQLGEIEDWIHSDLDGDAGFRLLPESSSQLVEF